MEGDCFNMEGLPDELVRRIFLSVEHPRTLIQCLPLSQKVRAMIEDQNFKVDYSKKCPSYELLIEATTVFQESVITSYYFLKGLGESDPRIIRIAAAPFDFLDRQFKLLASSSIGLFVCKREKFYFVNGMTSEQRLLPSPSSDPVHSGIIANPGQIGQYRIVQLEKTAHEKPTANVFCSIEHVWRIIVLSPLPFKEDAVVSFTDGIAGGDALFFPVQSSSRMLGVYVYSPFIKGDAGKYVALPGGFGGGPVNPEVTYQTAAGIVKGHFTVAEAFETEGRVTIKIWELRQDWGLVKDFQLRMIGISRIISFDPDDDNIVFLLQQSQLFYDIYSYMIEEENFRLMGRIRGIFGVDQVHFSAIAHRLWLP